MADEGTRSMTKARLLAEVRAGRAELEEALSRVPESRMEVAEPSGGWTVKDVLAHIAAWEARLAEILRAARGAGEPPRPIFGEAEVDRFNAETYAANHRRPLGEVLAAFRQAYETALAEVEATAEEDLCEPGRIARLGGRRSGTSSSGTRTTTTESTSSGSVSSPSRAVSSVAGPTEVSVPASLWGPRRRGPFCLAVPACAAPRLATPVPGS